MKMINNTLIGLLMLICINCKPQESIKIYTTKIYIETPFRIKSTDFEAYFQRQIDSAVVTRKKDIDDLERQISHLPMADKSKYSLPDIRYKLIICKREQCDTICGDMFTVVYKGKYLITTSSLINLIYKYSSQKNPE